VNVRLGIFARTYAGPLDDALDAARADGFGVVQLPATAQPPVALGSLEAIAVSGTQNMAHPDPAVRAEGARWLAERIAVAPALGTSCVTVCTGTRDPDDQWRGHPDNGTPAAWADMRASMEAALAVAESSGVVLGVEPEHHNVVSDARAAARLLDELGTPAGVRIVLDPANLLPDGPADQARVLEEAFELLGDRLVMGHAKDVAADGSVVPAGHGRLDYDRYVALLAAAPGDVPLVLHGLEPAQVAGSRDHVVAAMRRVGLEPTLTGT
jgi:sugar phosphate isomerase/epimerase